MTNLRKPVPDLMKGIAVIAMIQVHIMELFARQEILQGTIGKISLFLGGPVAAPVFMAVMGYFVAGSTRRPGDKGKRGVLLILLGLLLNVGLNFHLLIKIYNGTYNFNPLEYIFGADILFLAGLSIIAITLLDKIFRESLLPAIILAILIPLITPYLPDLPAEWKYFQAFFYGNATWSYFPLFPWLSYPLIGYALKKIEIRHFSAWEWVEDRKGIFLILAGSFIIITFLPACRIITHLPSYYHHHIFLFAWITGFLAIWTSLAFVMEKFAGQNFFMRYLKWLGKNVTAVYVIQWLIIGNIATAIYKTQDLSSLLLWFAAILLVTSILTYYLYSISRPKVI